MADISVVIPCYNANETLGLQLESLCHQLDAPEFNVIVVDNASPVSPEAVIEQFKGRLSIQLVRAAKAQGVAYARNVGLSLADANVVFLDADDCASPEFLHYAAQSLKDASFVTGNVISLEPQLFASGITQVWKELELRKSEQTDAFSSEIDPAYPIFMGGASAVRRDDALSIGGFDQSYVPGAEDNDFGIRAVRAGFVVQRCEGMTLAERRRMTSNQAFKRAYDGGRMHMRLCAGHDLWAVSPHLHNPEWWVDLAKLPLTGLKAIYTHDGPYWRRNWASRAGLRVGQAVGFATYKAARRPVHTCVGLGLGERAA